MWFCKKEELQLLSLQSGMSTEKLAYFLDNLSIALIAVGITFIWRLVIWSESRHKRSTWYIELIHQFAVCATLIIFNANIIKDILA